MKLPLRQELFEKYDHASTAIEEGVLGLDNMSKLKSKGAYIPADWRDVMSQLKSYHGMAYTLFGKD